MIERTYSKRYQNNILSSHGLQIDPNLSRNFEVKMSEVKKNRSLSVNPTSVSTEQKWLIRMNSLFRIRWDMIVMAWAIWNWVTIPFELTFEPEFGTNIYYIICNYFIDFLFTLDIFLTFRTTYVSSKTGYEIYEPKKIAKNYLLGRFWIDFFTIFPFTYIPFLRHLRAIGILKVSRVLRLGKIIDKLNAEEELKQTLNLFKLILNLLLFVHLIACVMYSIVNIEKQWVPTYDYMTATTEFYESGLASQFITMFFTGVLLLGGNEVGPRTEFELVFIILVLVISAIINAHIFGSLAVIIQELNKKSARFYEKLDTANTTMKNLKLSKSIQKRVINYIIYTQSGFDKIDEMKSFKKMLSPSLNTEVVKEIFSSIKPIFQDISSNLMDYVLEKITTCSYPPEGEIIKQGESAEYMYFLSAGEWVVMVKDRFKKVHQEKILKPGDLFGELALIANNKRTATIKTLNYWNCALLWKEDFQDIWIFFPEVLNRLKKRISTYNDRRRVFQKQMLRTVDFFQRLPEEIINELSLTLREQFYEK